MSPPIRSRGRQGVVEYLSMRLLQIYHEFSVLFLTRSVYFSPVLYFIRVYNCEQLTVGNKRICYVTCI